MPTEKASFKLGKLVEGWLLWQEATNINNIRMIFSATVRQHFILHTFSPTGAGFIVYTPLAM
jgi:hypothetical protein